MSRVSGFPPVVGRNPKILILGSMPGRASLDARQYYAQPRNAFWKIMGELFDASPNLGYSARLDNLKRRRVALWDVLASCVRPGSLDAAIRADSVVVNDFARLFQEHRTIRRVYFNGGKAAELYRRHVLDSVQLVAPYLSHARLPSTSPAHAAMPYDEKLRQWSTLLSSGDGNRDR